MPKVKTVKFKTKESKGEKIHRNLSRLINSTRRDLQLQANRKYGRGKVKITKVYASMILAGRLKR